MRVLWISVFVVIIDQITKLLVLQKMYVGQSIPLVGDWLKFTFTENPGMAFGITFGFEGLVPILSVSATLLILFYLYKVRHTYSWYRISIGFILGGAIGNIIDRVFYGAVIYGNRLFTGHVVDFIHVNLWRGYIPESWPFVGGKYAALFPIWNVADMAIVLGVVGILVFQNKFQESLIQAVPEHEGTDVVAAVAADAARSEHAEDTAVFPSETAGGNGVEEDTVKKDL